MSKRLSTLVSALLGFALAAAGAAARAQTGPTAVVNLGVASDYVFRGVDQTGRRGQFFAGADIAYKDYYAGAFASNVDLSRLGDPRARLETDIYGGWRPEVLGYDVDLGLIYYDYVDQARGARDDYVEASARVGRSIGPVSGAVSLHYTPDFRGHAGNGWYAEATASYALTRTVTASALVGRQTLQRAGDYTTWGAGATWGFAPHLGLDLRFWDTDRRDDGGPYGPKLVAALKATF